MAQKQDSRQVIYHPAPQMIGSAAETLLNSALGNIDSQLGKLFEDRNMILSDGGQITFTGTQVNFTQNMNLIMLQRQSGAVPTVISLGSTSVVLANGDIRIGVLNRQTNVVTQSTILSGNALPAVNNANQEVFFIMARADSADGTKRIIFRDGTTLNANQTARLGNSGSGGGGGINYFSKDGAPTPLSHNGDFEAGTIAPFSLFTTTYVGGIPTTVTAGAANLTAAVTTGNILAGSFSGQIVKATANANGQGLISDAITINREDLAKMLYLSFSYEVVLGTFNASGGANQSLEVWIQNVTTGQWIQPQGYRGINQITLPGKASMSFQTDYLAANNQYRVALIVNETASTGFTINFDDFVLAPQPVFQGPVITEWVHYNPTFQGFGTVTAFNFVSRRVGSSLEVKGNFIAGTVSGVTIASVSLGYLGINAGVGIDLGKLDNNQSVGTAEVTKNSATFFKVSPIYSNATGAGAVAFLVQTSTTASYGGSAAVGSAISDSGPGSVNISISVPIAGWSSNSLMSSDTDTRVLAAKVFTVGTQSVPSGVWTKVTTLGNVLNDTHGAWNTSSSRYQVPVSGFYAISFLPIFAQNGTGVRVAGMTINAGVAPTEGGAGADGSGSDLVGPNFFTIRNLVAGDIIEAAVYQDSLAALNLTAGSSFSVFRLSGPSVISATETVACRYINTAGTAVTGSGTTVPYPTKSYDTHGAYNPSTGIFTVPVSGKYRVAARFQTNPLTMSGTQGIFIQIFKGVGNNIEQSLLFGNGSSNNYNVGVTTEVDCVAGDQLFIVGASTVSTTLQAAQFGNVLSISRIGN